MGNFCNKSKSKSQVDLHDNNLLDIRTGLCNADPITKQGKRVQMMQMLLIPLIPMLFLIIQTSVTLEQTVSSQHGYHLSRDVTYFSLDILELISNFVKEKRLVCKYVSSRKSTITPDELQHSFDRSQNLVKSIVAMETNVSPWFLEDNKSYEFLEECQKNVLESKLTNWYHGISFYPEKFKDEKKIKIFNSNHGNITNSLIPMLSTLLPSQAISGPSSPTPTNKFGYFSKENGGSGNSLNGTDVMSCLDFYNQIISCLLNGVSESLVFTNESLLWRQLIAIRVLIMAENDYANLEVLGWVRLVEKIQVVNMEMRKMMINSMALSQENLDKAYYYDNQVQIFLNTKAKEQLLLWDPFNQSIADMSLYLILLDFAWKMSTFDLNSISEELNENLWTDRYSKFLRAMEETRDVMNIKVIEMVKEILSAANQRLIVASIILIIVVLLTPLIIFIISRIVLTIQNFAYGLSLKTKELRKEKKRSDALLYQMLPKSVALQLKLSKKVAAESYNNVTIFFSDIVGFTAISARSTPMQVVEFLNHLYFFFDTTIDKYDVYKVETIGDAYMVASGLPQRNGKRHVNEIACLALDLLEGIVNFEIPHLPEEKMKMRIGLHCGPVVAGVVGSKMPRYCLFGETVNIASKMESNGLPMKVHISSECMKALVDLGGWMIEKRGIVFIKGRGDVDTYFLLGRQA